MSAYTSHTSSSAQILSGFCTGCRLFIKLLVAASVIALAGAFVYNSGKGDANESADAVNTHRDIRRSIALSMAGDASARSGDRATPDRSKWKALPPSASAPGDPSGFRSSVQVRPIAGGISYQIIIGPYDPEVSRHLKQSSGWVNLKLLQSDGGPAPGCESGLKIPLSSFEFHQENGLPVGWIHLGSVAGASLAGNSDTSCFELGWVLPSRASSQRTVQIESR